MADQKSIAELLGAAASRLDAVSESARLDAEILLGLAIDMPRSYLFAHPEDQPDEAAVERFKRLLARRLAREPMAYLTGSKEFWSLELMVTPATLVPRPETEILVDRALREIPRKADWRILDLGTGSGAIALAIARERPLCTVVATDQSEAALDVARQNARQLELGNLEFLAGDWTEPVREQQFQLLVSNPPYVSADDPALLDMPAEPVSALAAGPDGLAAIRAIAAESAGLLVPAGCLLLEHGATQEAAVAEILGASGWVDIECIADYAGLPRVTLARRPAANADLC